MSGLGILARNVSDDIFLRLRPFMPDYSSVAPNYWEGDSFFFEEAPAAVVTAVLAIYPDEGKDYLIEQIPSLREWTKVIVELPQATFGGFLATHRRPDSRLSIYSVTASDEEVTVLSRLLDVSIAEVTSSRDHTRFSWR